MDRADLAAGPDEVVVVCIPTTPDRAASLAECVDLLARNAGHPHVVATYRNDHEGFVAAMHTILARLRPDTLIWSVGDDMRVTQPGTLARLVREFHARFPDRDGVVNPDDGIQRGRVATLPLCTARVMADNTPREFFHNFADDVMTERLAKAGKYAYLPDVRVVHAHWTAGLAPMDETYRVAQARFDQDRATYERLRAA